MKNQSKTNNYPDQDPEGAPFFIPKKVIEVIGNDIYKELAQRFRIPYRDSNSAQAKKLKEKYLNSESNRMMVKRAPLQVITPKI